MICQNEHLTDYETINSQFQDLFSFLSSGIYQLYVPYLCTYRNEEVFNASFCSFACSLLCNLINMRMPLCRHYIGFRC